jgi:hypothetical protein
VLWEETLERREKESEYSENYSRVTLREVYLIEEWRGTVKGQSEKETIGYSVT